ncbi:MAG: 50S ribosomal protein L15 [Legionellales bacterium]|nr:50S ribosomal protein L15 [Legionellales bacterium]
MNLNTIQPAIGAKRNARRVGRGIGCTKGKTCGRGHKGQHARAGGYHKVGFEGGQMPMQRRLPKFGFNSRGALVRDEITLDALQSMTAEVIDLHSLMLENVINRNIKDAKVILSGSINRAITIKGLRVTKGARQAIEAAGGKVED